MQKEIEIDHIEPVIEFGKTRSDYTIQEIYERIDCDIENLQRLCKECHKQKTKDEKVKRKKNK